MQQNIIKTLSYAQVFNFPLTLQEIHSRLIGKKSTLEEIKTQLLSLKLKPLKGYYSLGKQSQITNRISNQKYQKTKFKKAQKIAHLLKIFPSIQAVIITGAIAAGNAKKEDDIDFLIITTPNSLWITRLLVNLYLDILKVRRNISTTRVTDLACLNLWLTTKSLFIPKTKHNLYTAYEISLTKPLWQKNHTYDNFLFSNKWITSFLPNTKISTKSFPTKTKKSLGILNFLAFKLQSWYMKSKQTIESVSINSAFFHPRNTQQEIEKKYRKIYRQYRNI